METTGRFELPLIMPNQAQKHITHNEALTLIDGICHLVIKSFVETTPPLSSAIDDAFVVGAAATGLWYGEDGKIALNSDTGWRFVAPRQGMIALNAVSSKLMIFDLGIWKSLDSAIDIASAQLFGINTTADTTNRFAARTNAALLTAVSVSDGGNGDLQLKLNKEIASDTASLLYQTAFSGRAEMGLTGDEDFHIKVSPNGLTWTEAVQINRTTGVTTLVNNSISNAALSDMSSGQFKARTAAGSGDPQDITATQATALLDAFSTGLKGLAPASGGGTANFLRADGNWVVPSISGGVSWGSISGTLSTQADLQSALNSKEAVITGGTSAQYLKGDKTLGALDKTAVGLGNVDNISDVNKPVSSATQTALNSKAALAHTHAIADTTGLQTALDGKQASGSYANSVHTHGQADVTGLVAALAAKEPTITIGTSAQYWRGDKTMQSLDKAAVGLGNVDNTSDVNKPVSSATQTALNAKADVSHNHAAFTSAAAGFVTASGGGTANFLRADGTWAAPVGGGGAATWGTITGTLSAQTDLQAALSAKASLAGANFSGAVAGTTLSLSGGIDAGGYIASRSIYNDAPDASSNAQIYLRDQGAAIKANLHWDRVSDALALFVQGGATTGLYQKASDAIWRIGTAQVIHETNVPVSGQYRFYAFEDFMNTVASPAFSFVVSGTGAAHSLATFPDANSIGAVQGALGTVATGRVSISSATVTGFLLGQGNAKYKTRLRLSTLSDTTNTWTLRAGFIDSVSIETIDGAFFRYTNGVNGSKFQAVTRNNSAETAVDTLVTAAINTTYKFEIDVNASGTSVEFKINGAIVATTSTNIPNTPGRETGYGVYAQRSLGTTAVSCYLVDYLLIDLALTNAR